jgi:transcription termination factor Rho
MTTNARLVRDRGALVAATLLALTAGGCKEQKPDFEIVKLEGKVEAIERDTPSTGTITVRYFSDRHQTDMTGVGIVDENTQIMINGATAKFEDLREGDRVRGEVRLVQEGERRKQIALKINVDRPKPVDAP